MYSCSLFGSFLAIILHYISKSIKTELLMLNNSISKHRNWYFITIFPPSWIKPHFLFTLFPYKFVQAILFYNYHVSCSPVINSPVDFKVGTKITSIYITCKINYIIDIYHHRRQRVRVKGCFPQNFFETPPLTTFKIKSLDVSV